MFKLILLISIVINMANGHGHLREPPSRNPQNRPINQLVSQGCNVNFHNTYFTSKIRQIFLILIFPYNILILLDWDCSTVCGNFKGDSYSDSYFPDLSTKQESYLNYDTLRHNATKTYTSGQWINIVDFVS